MYQVVFGSSYRMTVLFMLVIEILLVVRLVRTKGFGKDRFWILVLLACSTVCSISDVLCITLAPQSGRLLNYLVNAFFWLSLVFASLVLFRHLEVYTGAKTFESRGTALVAYAPFVLLTVLLVVSYWTGIIFYVDGEGIYHRGPLYLFALAVLGEFYIYASLLQALYRRVSARHKLQAKYFHRVLLYVLPFFAGTVLQAMLSTIPGSNMGLTLTVVLVQLCAQDDLIEENAQANLKYEMILEGLARDFNAVYFADLKTDYIEVVKHNRANNGTKYDERMMVYHAGFDEINRLYCEGAILPEDQEAYLKFSDREVLMALLDDNDRVFHRYHITPNAMGQRNIEFQVAKLNETSDSYEVVMGYRGIDDLIANERAYQEQLEASLEQARIASMGKTNFLRRMSHDLRTPINGIMGMTEIAEHFPNDLEKQAECRAKIREASEYLLSLISDVLDMNKLESGSMELSLEPYDLRHLFQEQTAVATIAANEHHVSFIDETDYEGMAHPWVLCSAQYVKHLVNNITSNAVKYNHEGGKVLAKAEEVAFDGKAVTVRITVSDTGIGMSPEYLEHAFEPFSQEQRDDVRTKYASTGLGLSLVKELVDLMGGTIAVESEEGVGSTFTVELPFEVTEAPAGAAGAAAGAGAGTAGGAGAGAGAGTAGGAGAGAGAAGGDGATALADGAGAGASSVRGMHVLLVEDNDINMEIAQFMLENEGVIVDIAWNGEEAVQAFEQAPAGTYDAIFMDVMMPVMNGHEATRTIRGLDHPDAATVPIFAMTANAFVDDIARSKEAGMNAHITKPLNAEEIIAALRQG